MYARLNKSNYLALMTNHNNIIINLMCDAVWAGINSYQHSFVNLCGNPNIAGRSISNKLCQQNSHEHLLSGTNWRVPV